jgi:hypothetical protein
MVQNYATIGTDGMRPVVWGLGLSPEAAEEDAREQLQALGEACAEELVTVPVTEEQARRVEEGEVSTKALGLALPEAWLAELQRK